MASFFYLQNQRNKGDYVNPVPEDSEIHFMIKKNSKQSCFYNFKFFDFYDSIFESLIFSGVFGGYAIKYIFITFNEHFQ